MPLGVFAITEQDATDSGMNCAIGREQRRNPGGPRSITDITDSSRPVEGMVDRRVRVLRGNSRMARTQRSVMETVLSNLTEDEATALVHFGAEKTQMWLMVRFTGPGR